MKQALQMKLSQKLSMNLQLSQAIQLLQFSAQELREAVEKAYLENPTLEMEYPAEGLASTEHAEETRDFTAWTEYLRGDTSQPRYFTEEQDSHDFAAPAGITLEEELLRQARLVFRQEAELSAACFIIGSLDRNGYLTMRETEIARSLGQSEASVHQVLLRLQQFEPSGVCARDLRECLRIQAEQRGIYEDLVASLIDCHLERLAQGKIKEIANLEHCAPEDVQLAADILRTLNPKPGNSYGNEELQHVQPDVLAEKTEDGWQVAMLDDHIPKLRLSASYRNLQGYDKETRNYIGQKLRAAKWLISSIEQRRRTICKVVEDLVTCQHEAFEGGLQKLKPLTMKEVADHIGVHESTVSRAVHGKYVQLPWGVAAIKQFFQSSAGASDEDVLAVQVKQALREMIAQEDPQKPLSDQKLAELLAKKNMRISRRTVMKYREQLGYPSSVKRKRYE